jgi:hypothetical protein
MDFEFLKSRYDFELQRKEQLTAALTLPVAVLSGLGGAIVAMARSFTYTDEVLTRAFLVAVGFDIAAFIVCLVCLGLAYHRQHYSSFERLSTLEEWRNNYLTVLTLRGMRTDAESCVREDLRRCMIEAADRNSANNNARTGNLYVARLALCGVLFFTAAAGVPYVIDQWRYSDDRRCESVLRRGGSIPDG